MSLWIVGIFFEFTVLKKNQKFPGLFVADVKIQHEKNTAPDCKRNHQCFFLDKNIWNFVFPSVKWTNIFFWEVFTKYFFSKKLRRKPLETTWVNFDLEAPNHLRHGLPQPKFGCSSNPALKNPTQKNPVCWTTCWKLTKNRLTRTHIRSELEYLLKH